MTTFTKEQIEAAANLKMVSELGDTTVKEWLKGLLKTLIKEEEGFSGKRPLGNSGWLFDAYRVLVGSKLIDGEIDEEEGWVNKCDDKAGEALLLAIIDTF